jgi:hypothetical protein
MALPRPPGLITAILGGVIGGIAAVWTSVAIFEQLAVGDLSDLGLLLVLLAAGLIVGPSVGVTVALLIARHKNALATGMLTLPLMLAAVVVTFSLVDNVDRLTENPVVTALALGLALALAIAAIWLARHLTAARR